MDGEVKKKWLLGALVLIVLIGAFLRTYHFHDWLTMRDDQARDATLVSQVVKGELPWPEMGPFMSYSGAGDHSEENSFHLGPMYYYFQIISAKLFGNFPDKLAYPDAFFGILAIPLLYFFLRECFRRNISLGVTGLFAFSAYFIQYSRFAWNTNLIPFFVLLFLFASQKFLMECREDRWKWALVLGAAIGIGIQLHVILLAIFFLCALGIAVVSLKKDLGMWKQWMLIVIVAGMLNVTQITSEIATHFDNTRHLFGSASHRGSTGLDKVTSLLWNDIDCHIEANAYFLTSYGGDNCGHDFLGTSAYIGKHARYDTFADVFSVFERILFVLFAFGGYALLVKRSRHETDERKRYFLYLVSFYSVITFLVMFPLSVTKIDDFRYFLPMFFIPFVLLGLIMDAFFARYPRASWYIFGIFFALLLFTNGSALLQDQIQPLLMKDQTCASHFTTLGELEPVATYIASQE
ncbi:MAG: glycosyltransferase family 39 protein, partial [Candidatus Moraniibacteriota bacterium]